jgi:hypothetical protein
MGSTYSQRRTIAVCNQLIHVHHMRTRFHGTQLLSLLHSLKMAFFLLFRQDRTNASPDDHVITARNTQLLSVQIATLSLPTLEEKVKVLLFGNMVFALQRFPQLDGGRHDVNKQIFTELAIDF